MANQRRPNFFIVGAPKCGTTAWVEYLSRHPDVFFNALKETHVFATDFPGYREVHSIEEFLGLYADAKAATVLGDASPWHMRSEEAARNVKAFNPDAKILIMLREIGSFIPSYHNQILLNGDETNSNLAEVWAQSGPDRRIPPNCRNPKLINYKTTGNFSVQVSRYLSEFDASQIRLAWMEDWRANPGDFYRFLLEFLDLRPYSIEDFTPVNVARRHKSHLLASVLHDRKIVSPAARFLRRIGIGPLGLHTRLRQANMIEGYDRPAPSDLVSEIRAHYREDTERLHAILDGSGIVYKPPSRP
jgi:hypothetical protein